MSDWYQDSHASKKFLKKVFKQFLKQTQEPYDVRSKIDDVGNLILEVKGVNE
jgi:hypothetical protein